MTKSHNDHPSNGTRLARLRHRETYESATFCPPADHLVSWCRMGPKGHDENAKQRKRSHHGKRVVLSLDLEPHVRDALRERAAAAGVSMTEYVTNAIVKPERVYATSVAQFARPLVAVSYGLARLRHAVNATNDVDLIVRMNEVQRTITDLLRPLARRHDAEVQQNERAQ